MANYYFTIPDSVTLPTDGNKVSLTTDCELHRDDSALPNALTVAADSYNVFLADTPGTGTATAPDVTAPTLSSPTGAKSGETGATSLGVSTDEGNGTLYWGIYPTASTPSAADVVAGTGATVNGSQAVSGTGVQSVSDQTGLTAATAYKAHYVQDDAASNRSSVATSSEFTTDAAAGAFYEDDFESRTVGDVISADTDWASVYYTGSNPIKVQSFGGGKAAGRDLGAGYQGVGFVGAGIPASRRVSLDYKQGRDGAAGVVFRLMLIYGDESNLAMFALQTSGSVVTELRSGGSTLFSDVQTPTISADDTFSIEWDDTAGQLISKINGTAIYTSSTGLTLPTYSNPGYMIWGSGSATFVPRIDNFKIEDIS